MEKRRPEESWGHATAFEDLQVGIGTCSYGIVPDAVIRRYKVQVGRRWKRAGANGMVVWMTQYAGNGAVLPV